MSDLTNDPTPTESIECPYDWVLKPGFIFDKYVCSLCSIPKPVEL